MNLNKPQNLIELIGNTPLIFFDFYKLFGINKNVKIYAKAEYFNPGGSVKDRPVKNMIFSALSSNLLKNKILIDATSGNTGIAYAMIAASLQIPIELALPENASHERKKILELYGVKIHYTSKLEGTDGAQNFVKELVSKNPNLYYYPDQYNNENNWKAHYTTTGPEIWEQTSEKVTHFCCGIGTSGTFIGTSKFLKTKGVKCFEITPNNPIHGLEGWKHLETAIVPGIYDPKIADKKIEVGTEDAFSFAIFLARKTGFLLSPSASANLFVALTIAKNLDEGSVVTILPDNAMKYLNDPFWNNKIYHNFTLS